MNYMIQHYLKTAIRNLLKYKTHSIISAICLSVGMTCFSIIHFFINEIDGASRNMPNFEQRISIRMINSNHEVGGWGWSLNSSEIRTLTEHPIPGIKQICFHSFQREDEVLDNPTGGEYYLNGKEVSKYTESQRTNLRKGVIGFVFQSFNLIDELNVYENIELPLLYMGIPASERKQRVEKAMERMAITHRSKHFPQQLSGGQQQRVAIARAVVANPKLILADEPTGNLDSKNGKEVMGLLSELNKEGTTIVMVTHSQHDAGFADRVINLFDGQVVTEVTI